ncbi:MAG: hypothetical protein JSS83_25885 [Cyanobacteria bacterium SZAS LIN-3]|nr:hypothetical protein [Cyanobacteria bacterium SZAS LIN-3]MBS2007344.1 hypothetical protein [Cyanobacteria bacterium SZAS TMP-1]
MLIFSSSFSLLLLGVILLGAYKVWMGITHLLSKPFHQAEERHIKKISFIVVAITVLMMVSPFLIPTALGFKEFVGVLYIIYGGTSVYQIYSWFNRDSGDKKDSSKDDKNGK